MFPSMQNRGVPASQNVTRRDFLRVGSLTAGVSLTGQLARGAGATSRGRRCILLFLVGGPSHMDTWDPKPLAPAEIRGPFRPIQTRVPGLHLSELFPEMARRTDRIALVRSVHHTAAAIHEAGQQLLQTGHLSRGEVEFPHYGSVLSCLRGPGAAGEPSFVIVPGPIGNTGVAIAHGQDAGFLGPHHAPTYRQPTAAALAGARERDRERYGRHTFGQSCLLARQLVEGGVDLVAVNMFDTVYGQTTWDCHAAGGALATTLDDYRTTVCPMFDQTYTALLDDLDQRGLLESTLVVAMGEFGRTPRLNSCGGRDHWPGVWTILFAGGGIRGGQVIGASDRTGAEPSDGPVTPAEVAATIYHLLGVPPGTRLPGPDGRLLTLVEAAPLRELERR
jgi:uncharacterized protein (DUF1501 family)